MSGRIETTTFSNNNLPHLQNLSRHQRKYRKGKLLSEIVTDCASNSDLPPQLRDKLSRILLESSCSQMLSLESQGSGAQCSAVLGCLSLEDAVNYMEIRLLEPAVIAALRKKRSLIRDEFKVITGQDIDGVNFESVGPHLSRSDTVLLNRRKQLSALQERYGENLLKQQEILEKLTKLRVVEVPKVTGKKVKQYHVQTRMNELRLRLLNQKTRVDVFLETSNSLDAYKQLMMDIEKQQEACRQEIAHLETMKEKYAEVSSKHFQELLNVYKQYKMSIEKKKSWYSSLKTTD